MNFMRGEGRQGDNKAPGAPGEQPTTVRAGFVDDLWVKTDNLSFKPAPTNPFT
jgi:hypothetical protein